MDSLSDRDGNRVRRAFPAEVSTRLAGVFEPVALHRSTVLLAPGAPTEHLYFPDRGLISLVKIMEDGRSVEVGAIGADGMSGMGALFGIPQSAFEQIVQLDGTGHRIPTATLRAEMERSPALAALMTRYVYYSVVRLGQTAACNRLHRLRERCCRWLLTAHDSARTDSFVLTHDFLALMMGVNRTSLSLTLAALQRQGHIVYRRATITIRNRRALEEGSCECYESLRRASEAMFDLKART